MTFRTATPSNSLLWDITLDMGADGAIAVICQRKAPIPGKRQVCSLHITPCASVLCVICVYFAVAVYHCIHIYRLKLFEWTNNTLKVQRGFFMYS